MRSSVGRLLLATILLSACAAKPPEVELPFPAPDANCLLLRYAPEDSTGDAFPTRLALDPAVPSDSGRAYWIPPADSTSRIWEMFFANGTWYPAPGDSLRLRFTNGFTDVVLRVHSVGDSVTGEASWLSDVVGQDFSAPFVGRHLRCPWRDD